MAMDYERTRDDYFGMRATLLAAILYEGYAQDVPNTAWPEPAWYVSARPERVRDLDAWMEVQADALGRAGFHVRRATPQEVPDRPALVVSREL
jgi:hypothetical protein